MVKAFGEMRIMKGKIHISTGVKISAVVVALVGLIVVGKGRIAAEYRQSLSDMMHSEEALLAVPTAAAAQAKIAETVEEKAPAGSIYKPGAIRVEPKAMPDHITFSAVGDNLIHETLINQAAENADYGGYDFSYFYADVAPYFQSRDLSWINVETIINDAIEPAGYPNFSTPAASGTALYNAGFDIYSLASNHTYDYGDYGVLATRTYWENDAPKNILTTGIWTDDAYIPVYAVDGHSIAFLTYSYGSNGFSDGESGHIITLDQPELIEWQIRQAKQMAEAVVVSCHWGAEDSHEVTENQRQLASFIAECGADLIIGAHPHVIQGAEWIPTSDGRSVFCAYSIGNFVSAQTRADELLGYCLNATFDFHKDGTPVTLSDVSLTPMVTMYGYNRENIHTKFLSQCTADELDSHGVALYAPEFCANYVYSFFGSRPECSL